MKLLRLTYENFKAQTQNIVLNEADVDIFGANGAGKTTAFDAFTWLLFGKDSKGRELSDDIKTRSETDNGKDHSVEAVILLDGGAHVKLKRVFHEKWTKKRGSATETFSGHDTDFFIDDVPTKKREYTERINDIMDEAHFKLLTDPLYFKNQLSWQERRKILLEICGDVPDETVIAAKEELAALPEMLGGKAIDDYRKMIQASRAKTNDELKKIPVRIDEVQRGLPDVEGIVEEPLRMEIKDLQKQKESVDRKIAALHAGGTIAEKKRVIAELETKQIAVKNRYDREINKVALEKQKKRGELETDIQRAESSVSILNGRMEALQADIEAKGEAIRKTREEWHAENNKTFSAEIADVCPTCGQKIPHEKVEEAREKAKADFSRKKSETLAVITARGKTLVDKLQASGEELERLQGSAEAAEEKIRLAKADIAALTSLEDMIADYTQDEEYLAAEREKERLLAEMEQLAKGVESESHNQAVTNRAGSSPAFGTKYHGSTGTSVGPFLMGKFWLIHAVYGICRPFFPVFFMFPCHDQTMYENMRVMAGDEGRHEAALANPVFPDDAQFDTCILGGMRHADGEVGGGLPSYGKDVGCRAGGRHPHPHAGRNDSHRHRGYRRSSEVKSRSR